MTMFVEFWKKLIEDFEEHFFLSQAVKILNLDPDPHQNVMDTPHCYIQLWSLISIRLRPFRAYLSKLYSILRLLY